MHPKEQMCLSALLETIQFVCTAKVERKGTCLCEFGSGSVELSLSGSLEF